MPRGIHIPVKQLFPTPPDSKGKEKGAVSQVRMAARPKKRAGQGDNVHGNWQGHDDDYDDDGDDDSGVWWLSSGAYLLPGRLPGTRD